MIFNVDDFVKTIHDKLKKDFSLEEIKSTLIMEDDAYIKDNPISESRFLKLNRLIINGKKNDNSIIQYDKFFHKGINMWIADNSTGKSSIFKIIKFAFTGSRESIKQDVRGWINEIIIEFEINSITYTLKILNNKNFNLYKQVNIDSLSVNDPPDENVEISSKTLADYTGQINKFFLRELGFYTLEGTSHYSQKDKPGLRPNPATWCTYFKSIYLESKDYDKLFFAEDFGSGDKIFQMLLGLELTYPINKLVNKRDLLKSELGTIKAAESLQQSKPSNAEQIRTDLKNVIAKIDELKKQPNQNKSFELIENQYNAEIVRKEVVIRAKTEALNALMKNRDKEINNLIELRNNHTSESIRFSKLINSLRGKLNSLSENRKEIDNQIKKNSREMLRIQEDVDFGLFFNNLDVKVCPHCDNLIPKENKLKEKQAGTCMLCDHELKQKDADVTHLKEKITELTEENQSLKIQIEKIGNQITELKNQLSENEKHQKDNEKQYEKTGILIDELKEKTCTIDESMYSTVEIDKKLVELEAELNNQKSNQVKILADLENLSEQKGAFEYQLKNLSNKETPDNNVVKKGKQMELYEQAIKYLTDYRTERSKNIISKLEKSILNMLHEFGISSITAVSISPELKITYTQNNTTVGFEEINEGEKLRAKLSFYLSLIELDIKEKIGKHPHFIILDSPSKEEGDKKYLEGLREAISNIEKKFKNNIQVFVGTANRELEIPISSEKLEIKKTGEFVF